MELQSLKYFYAVAQAGSFLAAAQKLGYAQSNLSVRIRNLEKELGTPLFIRSKEGTQLTERGRLLLAYAEKILPLAEEAESAVKYGQPRRTQLRIGSLESAAMTYVPALLAAYHQKFSAVALAVTTGTTAENIARLQNHGIDCAFIAGQLPGEHFSAIRLPDAPLCVVAAADTPAEEPLEKVLQKPLVVFPEGCTYRRQLEALLAAKGLVPSGMITLSSLGAILASVSAGLGVSLFPERLLPCFAGGSALQHYEVPAAFRFLPNYFIYQKDDDDTALADFCQCLPVYEKE